MTSQRNTSSGPQPVPRADPSLWEFAGLIPLRMAEQATRKLGEDELFTRSSSLAYYLLLSIFPMLLFLVSLLGLIMGSHS